MADDPNDLSAILSPQDSGGGGDDQPPSALELANASQTPLGAKQKRISQVDSEIDSAKARRDAAYQSMRDALSQATQRLQGMQIGPGEAEQNHMLAAQLARPGRGRGSDAMGDYYATQANIEREKRLGDMPTRDKLALQYAMAGPQYAAQQANTQITQDISQKRAEQMGANPYISQQTRYGIAELSKGLAPIVPNDPSKGVYVIKNFAQDKSFIDAMDAVAKDRGLVKQTDAAGNVTYVPRKNLVPGPQPGQPNIGPGPQAPAPALDPSRLRQAAAGSAAANAAAAATPQPQQKGPISPGLFPVYTGQMGGTGNSPSALAQPDMPQAYADVANNAFAPQNFDGLYRVGANGGVSPEVLKQNEKDSAAYKKMADGAKEQNYYYGKMLHMIDNGEINTGGWETKLTALKQSLQGFLGDETLSEDQKSLAKELLGKKVATEQEFDKLAWSAGTIGLTSKFGNRVLQAEFSANMKAQPNREMSLLAMKLLMSAQLDRNLETINKQKVHALYAAHQGNPMLFDTFYDQHFDPYGQSPLASHIQQREAQKQKAQAAVQQVAPLSVEEKKARIAALEAKRRAGTQPMGPPVPAAPGSGSAWPPTD